MDVSATLKRSARYAWTAFAFLIISYALLVVIGRLLLPSLEQRQEFINQLLSRQLGIEITTEHLGGSWTRFTPRFQAQSLRIAAEGKAPAITVSSINSEFDILHSILNAEIVWNDLSIGEVKMTLREDAEGNWFVSNFPLSSPRSETNSRGQLDALINIIQLSTHIGIDQVAIDIAFFDGTATTLYINGVQIEGNGNFHRARAQLSLDQQENKAELLIEGRGNPLDWQAFDGKAYISASRINLHKALGLILRSWQPFSSLGKTTDASTLLDAELWISTLKPGHFNLRGKVQAEEIPVNWNTELPPLKNFSTTLKGWYNSGENWGLQCQDLRFDWDGKVIQPLNASFQQGLGEHWHEISLAADHINIDTLKHGLMRSQFTDKASTELIEALNPSGTLRNIQLSLDLENTQPLTQVDVNIEQLSLDSWHQTPAVRGLSGYLHWQHESGYFDLATGDDFALRYPGVYTHFMHYGSTQGRVNIDWTSADSSLQIAGGPLAIDAEEGRIRAYISLDLPTNGDREPQMFLQAGIKNSHSRYLDNYLPAILDPGLRNWLDSAIGDIDIDEAGFIWRGSLVGDSHQQRSIQLQAQIARGDVNYDPGWPTLSELSAQITLDDTQLTGSIDSARAGEGQVQVKQATFATLPGALLAVQAQLSSPLNTAQQILLSSPLAPQLAALADWEVEGQTEATLDLVIPLSKNRQGESYRVDAQLEGERLQLRSFQPLTFNELEGSIAYDHSTGLYSPGVSATLWGQALNATITTHKGRIQLDAAGQLDLSKAPAWQPLFSENISGTSTYTATFIAPHKASPATLSLISDLKGIAVDLPYPLHKPADQAWPLETSLQFRANDILLNAQTEGLKAQLRFADQQLADGTISIGESSIGESSLGKNTRGNSTLDNSDPSKAQAPTFEGLLIEGHMTEFNLDAWLAAVPVNAIAADGPTTDFETRATVTIDQLSAAGFDIDAVTVDALRSQRLWAINIDSPMMAGDIHVPEDRSQSIIARLNYIALPKPELGSEQSPLNNLDPSTLPALDFATEGLRIGDDELGSLAFVMQASENGVSIDQIEAEITGIAITNSADGDAAKFTWQRIDGEDQSQFSGALLSDDLGGVLRAWDLPMLLTTHNAAILSDLSWQGKPWDLSIDTLEGHLALNFDKGRFYQATGTSTNVLLKVIGVINFHTWMRRLKLDFSDLLANGVEYDHLEGGLAFHRGQMRFEEPIEVTLPAAKIRLQGHANLLTETIDAHVVATLPVGTNLPWIVALVGGLPAAAGVYITGKIFERQVDQISSFSYKLSGDLDQPKIEVDRIFSDKSKHSQPQPPSATQSPP